MLMMTLDGPVSRIYSRDLLPTNFSEITALWDFRSLNESVRNE